MADRYRCQSCAMLGEGAPIYCEICVRDAAIARKLDTPTPVPAASERMTAEEDNAIDVASAILWEDQPLSREERRVIATILETLAVSRRSLERELAVITKERNDYAAQVCEQLDALSPQPDRAKADGLTDDDRANAEAYRMFRKAVRRAEAAEARAETARSALEKAEAALDLYSNVDHWQGDTFRPVRLEAGCRCLCCYEAFSDKGDAAREACTAVESALALRTAPPPTAKDRTDG